ncbi:probable ubiquitin thioesterase DG1039 isoform X3 [Lolium rigidum]|uniref:probable ubiquitin thioesterase DG1039 isoform X3 n=1 Tax=Lolium rigidum TaxID=89674 RepID=UPI001F5D744C|nr:probable ubiquitin thioesterase DG1039 isoform X3 [Lolium rigidum]
MSNRRFENGQRKCGTHSATGTTMYLGTADVQKITHCQVIHPTTIDHDVGGSCAVKHHYPSPIVSWIEDLSSFGSAPFSHETEYVDEQSRPLVGQSSASSNLRDMQISVRLTDEFMELAKENTSNNLETCGILGASFRDGAYYVTTLVIPKQEATAHSVCHAKLLMRRRYMLYYQSNHFTLQGGYILTLHKRAFSHRSICTLSTLTRLCYQKPLQLLLLRQILLGAMEYSG